jgi:hypothetical protein
VRELPFHRPQSPPAHFPVNHHRYILQSRITRSFDTERFHWTLETVGSLSCS